MNRQHDPGFDQRIADWLEDDPDSAPSNVLQTVLAAYPSIPQRRRWRYPWRLPTVNRFALIAAAAVIALLAVIVVALPHGGGGPGGPVPTASPSPSPSTSPTASPSPTATVASVALGAEGTDMLPGTYTPLFQPAFNFTVTNEIVTDCPPSVQCSWPIDKNEAGWVDIEFGTEQSSEFMAIRLDKVIDPAAPANLIDPPADLAAWMGSLPGTAVLGAPKPVLIGGLPASQFDEKTPGEMQFGHIAGTTDQAGIGPSGLRLIVLRVHDQVVLISEWLGPQNTARDGAAALTNLQPLIDSITWQ